MPLRAACDRKLVRQNLRIAKELYPDLSHLQLLGSARSHSDAPSFRMQE